MTDTPIDGKDRAESEAEAANRQNSEAAREIGDDSFSPPGGEDTHAAAGGNGPTGQPQATSHPETVKIDGGGQRGDDDGAERGMLGEGV